MNINVVGQQIFDWVESQGWHNKTNLEALALICSEAGEAMNQTRGKKITKKFGIELADIILRTLDLAKMNGLNIEDYIIEKLDWNIKHGKKKGRIY